MLAVALVGAGCAIKGPTIVSRYGDLHTALGSSVEFRRHLPHSGIDFSGYVGDPVLAAADGEVIRIVNGASGCGEGVIIRHWPYNLNTMYCHLDHIGVVAAQPVRRGEVIGTMGESGDAQSCRSVRPCPHVHLELTNRDRGHPGVVPGVTFDPAPYLEGCFEAARSYPSDRLVLTYPVRCTN